MTAPPTPQPTTQERHQAVCRAMTGAPGLIRYAARFTRSIEDAEDAYQRAMEIALTKAPVTDDEPFSAWLHTVVRREALAIARTRGREVPAEGSTIDASLAAVATAAPADAVLEWRERYRAIQDALHGLTDSQRMCLMLRSAGASRPEIQALTGFSERKVHRSIAEARSRLQAFELRLASGRECERMQDLMDRVIDEGAERRDRAALSRHVRHCGSCRAEYRHRREQVRQLGSLVPGVLVAVSQVDAAPPDPSILISWWERASAGATVRTGHAIQVLADLPAAAATKAGAGAVAAVAAGVIGAPMMIGSVHADHSAPTPTPTHRTAAAPTATAPARVIAPTTGPPVPGRTATPRASSPPAPSSDALTQATETAAARARPPGTGRAPTTRAADVGAAASEFDP